MKIWWHRIAPEPLLQMCATFDPTPLAVGSVSQVHRITTRDGQILAVKIQRPALATLMATDLRIMRALGRLARRWRPLRDLPLVEAIDEVGHVLRAQLDFELEAKTLDRYRQLLVSCSDVRMPRTYGEWSNKYVLCQELITGLVRIDDAAISDNDFRYLAGLLLHAIYRMIFVAGVVHCDLHPANIYACRGKLVILDAGFSVDLTENTRAEFARFFRALAFGEARTCADIMRRTASAERPAFDFESFLKDVEVIIGESTGRVARDFSVAVFAVRLFDCQRRHGLVASSEFVMNAWSLLVVEGIIRQRWPDVDFQARAVPYLTGAVLRDIAVRSD